MNKSKIRIFTNKLDWISRNIPLGFKLKFMLDSVKRNPKLYKIINL